MNPSASPAASQTSHSPMSSPVFRTTVRRPRDRQRHIGTLFRSTHQCRYGNAFGGKLNKIYSFPIFASAIVTDFVVVNSSQTDPARGKRTESAEHITPEPLIVASSSVLQASVPAGIVIGCISEKLVFSWVGLGLLDAVRPMSYKWLREYRKEQIGICS